MSNTIQLKRSSVASKAPLLADLTDGEIALNSTDGRIYYRHSSGTSIEEIKASEVTNGVYTTGNQTISGEKTFDKIGIGTTSPTERLHVIGNGLFSGTLSASNLSGTNTGDQDLSGLVPYTGATTSISLGSQNLLTTGSITGEIFNTNPYNFSTGSTEIRERIVLEGNPAMEGDGQAISWKWTNAGLNTARINTRATGSSSDILEFWTSQFGSFTKALSLGDDSSSFTGNVGIGTASPSARLHAISTTEQVRFGYDVSNYWNATTSSTGVTTFGAAGSSAQFVFANDVSAPNLSGTNTGDQDLSGLVPYTGAAADVNIGEYSLTAGGIYVNDRDIEIENISSGLILHSPLGNRFRITIANDGALITSIILEPDAAAYIDLLVAAGATVTSAQRAAIDTFIRAEKAASRWDLLRRLYLPIWGIEAANAICLKSRTSGTFEGGVTHEAGYVQGDGSTGYFDTGAASNSLIATASGFFGTLNKTGLTGANQSSAASGASTGSSSARSGSQNSGVIPQALWLGANVIRSGSLGTAGILTAARFDGATISSRRNSLGFTEDSNVAATTAAMGSNNFVFLASNTGAGFTSHEVGAGFVSDGLNATNRETFTLALKDLWETCTGLTLP